MEISIQTEYIISHYGYEKGYELINNAGFKKVDWALDFAWTNKGHIVKENGIIKECLYDMPLDKIIEFYKEEIDIRKKYGITCAQAHSVYPSYYFEKPDFIDYAIECHKKCILLCDYVGCPYLVIHGISRPQGQNMLSLEEIDKLNLKLYESLIPTLLKTNVTVCLENLYTSWDILGRGIGHCSDPHQAIDIIDYLNKKAGKECFGLCLDTGHLNMMHLDMKDYISKLSTRIKCLHVNDNPNITDSHLAPYTGTIVWSDFYDTLKKVGYKGDMNFETFLQTSTGKIPPEFLPEMLRHIAAIGNFFISKIK